MTEGLSNKLIFYPLNKPYHNEDMLDNDTLISYGFMWSDDERAWIKTN